MGYPHLENLQTRFIEHAALLIAHRWILGTQAFWIFCRDLGLWVSWEVEIYAMQDMDVSEKGGYTAIYGNFHGEDDAKPLERGGSQHFQTNPMSQVVQWVWSAIIARWKKLSSRWTTDQVSGRLI